MTSKFLQVSNVPTSIVVVVIVASPSRVNLWKEVRVNDFVEYQNIKQKDCQITVGGIRVLDSFKDLSFRPENCASWFQGPL